MMDTNTLRILQKLANVNKVVDEFDGLTGACSLNSDLRDALADIREKERKAATTEAAYAVLEQLKESANLIDKFRQHLADVRRQEKIYIARIENLAVAAEYGSETTNYVPLARLVGADGAIGGIAPEDCVPKADHDRLLKAIRENLRSSAAAKAVKKPSRQKTGTAT